MSLQTIRTRARQLSKSFKQMGMCDEVRLVYAEDDDILLRFKNVAEENRLVLGHMLIALGFSDVRWEEDRGDIIASPDGFRFKSQRN